MAKSAPKKSLTKVKSLWDEVVGNLTESVLFDIDSLNTSIEDRLKPVIGGIPKLTASQAASLFVQIRGMTDLIENVTKPLGELRERLKVEIVPARFEDEDTTSLTLDSGHRVTVAQKLNVSMRDKDKGKEWLRNNGLDALIVETVNSQTLTAAARQRMEEGLDMPDDIFSVNTVALTSITKTK